MIPGTALPLLDLFWAWKIVKSLGLADPILSFFGMSTAKGKAAKKDRVKEAAEIASAGPTLGGLDRGLQSSGNLAAMDGGRSRSRSRGRKD